MTTAEQTAAMPTQSPLDKPLHPAHPQAPSQPVLVADQLTGAPVWIYPNTPPPSPPPRVDPVAQRILAAGAAAPLVGWGGSLFFSAMAGATTGLGYAAICAVSYAVVRSGGAKTGGNNVNIRIDNRGH